MEGNQQNNNETNNKSFKNNTNNRSEEKKTSKKRMPIWMLVLTDILLAAICLGLFSLYQLVLPQKLSSKGIIVASANDNDENTFQLPSDENSANNIENSDINSLDNGTTNSDSNVIADNNQTNGADNIDTSTSADSKKASSKVNIDGTVSTNNKANGTDNIDNDISTNNNQSNDTVIKENTGNTGKNTGDTGSTGNAGNAGNADGNTGIHNNSNHNTNNTVDTDNNQSSNKSNINGSNDSSTGTKMPSGNDGRAPRIGGGYTNYGNTSTDEISSNVSESAYISSNDKVVTEVNSYRDDNIDFTINKVELGSGNKKITYYASDIYVTNVKYLKTAFANGTYGKNIKDTSVNMANENNAILAISGDYYGNSETSVVIRNGILYRSAANDADVCVLFIDGTMKTYSPKDFNADELITQGAWQAWTFGPGLLDGKGNILKAFNTTDYIYSENPRCAIGYVAPGHYVFVVVDGRDPGYSRGATLNELSQIMIEEGCMTAYNLDGGKSASMVYDGAFVNQPVQGGREISDIIYLGE